MAIKPHDTHLLEYGQQTVAVTAKDGRISFGTPDEELTFTAADWPQVENDVRELLGLPKHRTRKKEGK